MKNQIFAVLLFASLAVIGSSLTYGQTVKEILNDPEKQKEAFELIASDHSLMMKFMETVKQNEHGKSMMMEGMMGMSKEDTTMGNMMTMKMMNDPDMMKTMMKNMMMKAEQDTAMGMQMCKMMIENDKMKSMMGKMMNMKDKHNNMHHMHHMNDMEKNDDDKMKKEDDHSKHH